MLKQIALALAVMLFACGSAFAMPNEAGGGSDSELGGPGGSGGLTSDHGILGTAGGEGSGPGKEESVGGGGGLTGRDGGPGGEGHGPAGDH